MRAGLAPSLTPTSPARPRSPPCTAAGWHCPGAPPPPAPQPGRGRGCPAEAAHGGPSLPPARLTGPAGNQRRAAGTDSSAVPDEEGAQRGGGAGCARGRAARRGSARLGRCPLGGSGSPGVRAGAGALQSRFHVTGRDKCKHGGCPRGHCRGGRPRRGGGQERMGKPVGERSDKPPGQHQLSKPSCTSLAINLEKPKLGGRLSPEAESRGELRLFVSRTPGPAPSVATYALLLVTFIFIFFEATQTTLLKLVASLVREGLKGRDGAGTARQASAGCFKPAVRAHHWGRQRGAPCTLGHAPRIVRRAWRQSLGGDAGGTLKSQHAASETFPSRRFPQESNC